MLDPKQTRFRGADTSYWLNSHDYFLLTYIYVVDQRASRQAVQNSPRREAISAAEQHYDRRRLHINTFSHVLLDENDRGHLAIQMIPKSHEFFSRTNVHPFRD